MIIHSLTQQKKNNMSPNKIDLNALLESTLFLNGPVSEDIELFLQSTTSRGLGGVFTTFMRDIFNDKYQQTYCPVKYSQGLKMLVDSAISFKKDKDYLCELDFFCTRSYGATKDDELSSAFLFELYQVINDDSINFNDFTQLKLLLKMQNHIIQPMVEVRDCIEFGLALEEHVLSSHFQNDDITVKEDVFSFQNLQRNTL